MRIAVLVVALLSACGPSGPAPVTSVTTGPIPFSWASFQAHGEPRYRLLFEGGSDAVRPSEVRVLDRGSPVATVDTKPSDADPMRLCGGGTKSGPAGPYGSVRGTFVVSEEIFRDFSFRRPSDFRVEARVAQIWMPVTLTNVCHMQE